MAHDDQRPFLQAWAEEIMSDSRYTDKKIKFSSYIRKVRVEQLQSHIWLLKASSYMGKSLRISSYTYEEALPHIWLCNCSTLNILIYEENLIFFFFSVHYYGHGLIIAHTVKNRLAIFLSPAGMSLTKLSLTENNLIPARMSSSSFIEPNATGHHQWSAAGKKQHF